MKWFDKLFGGKAKVSKDPADLVLPRWAKVGPSKDKMAVVLKADMDGAMTEWFELLGNPKPDQYWLEVAYQCAKMDLQMALSGTQFDPRNAGKSSELHFSRAPQWAQSAFPKGKGADAATQGREARGHYQRVRGRLPF